MRQINSQIQLFLSVIEPSEQQDFWNYLGEAADFCEEFMDGIRPFEHGKFPEILAFINWVNTFSECLDDHYQSLISEVENAGNEKNQQT